MWRSLDERIAGPPLRTGRLQRYGAPKTGCRRAPSLRVAYLQQRPRTAPLAGAPGVRDGKSCRTPIGLQRVRGTAGWNRRVRFGNPGGTEDSGAEQSSKGAVFRRLTGKPNQHRKGESVPTALLGIYGVDLAMASTILPLRNPAVFQIVDRHAYRTVYGCEYTLSRQYTDYAVSMLQAASVFVASAVHRVVCDCA